MLKLYRFLIGLLGAVHLGTATVMGAIVVKGMVDGAPLEGLPTLTLGLAALTAFAGLPLLLKGIQPGFMRAPRSVWHPLLVLVTLAIIAAVVWLGMGYAGDVYGTLPGQLALAMIPAALTAGLGSLVIMPLAFAVLRKNPDFNAETIAREELETHFGPDDALTRILSLLAYVLTVGLAALAVTAMAYSYGYLPSKPLIPVIGSGHQDSKIAIFALAFPLVAILPIRKIWGSSLRPRSLGEVFKRLVKLALIAAPALYFAERMTAAFLPAPFDQLHASRFELTGVLVAAITLLSIMISMRGPRLSDFQDKPMAAAPAAGPVRGSKLVQKPKTKGPAPVKIPDAGILMKTYIITDWLFLRIYGLGLLGMAWMIYQAGDDLSKIGGILYGIKPQTVMMVYAAWGALLIMPALLPRFISRPMTVFGGAAKATILVLLTLLFIPALDAAIDIYVARDYQQALHAAVPKVFKAVAGIAVFSAVAISLFRHLGGGAQVIDGMGKPAYKFSSNELRDLRAARMHG